MPRLIELAGNFEFQAEHAWVDWQGLQAIGFAHPILALLKNTNVVILTGGGRDGAEEVAVWDPIHRDSELLFVPRQEFERAWSGDVVRVTLRPSSTTSPSLQLPGLASEPPSERSHAPLDSVRQQGAAHSEQPIDAEKLPKTLLVTPDIRKQQRSPVMRFCVGAVGLVATVGIGLFLFIRPAVENFAPTNPSVGEAPERVAEDAQSKARAASGHSADQETVSVTSSSAAPAPNAPRSAMAAAPPTPPDEPPLEGSNRLAAAPPEPEATVEVRAPKPSLAVPMPAAPPASGVVTSEPDLTASNSAPVNSLVDASLSAAEIAVLLARGDKSFSSGDVASARLYYGRAADAGDGQAALRLGETFDPVFLERAHLRSARGDLTAAWSWYRRARDLGVAEGEVLLNSLEAK
jgi:hypothetical protein